MDFIVSDRQSIEHGLVVMTPYIVISIRDPGTQKPRLRCGAGFQDALYLAFHDAEPSNDFELPSEIVLMTREDANQV